MTVEKQIMEVREKQAFWQGVARGVRSCALWVGGTLIGTAAFIYYLLEIIKSLKELGC